MKLETGPELPPSRLYTFIDQPREFALYFLEGQRLIRDLALLHTIHGDGFAYFRDVVLSIQPMIAFLKHGEQLGFYIDSAEPYFRLKIEAGHQGATRSALVPEEFRDFPRSMKGLVRVQKVAPRRAPYESVLAIEDLPLREIVNRVLRDSYQTNSAVLVSESSDQSLLLHQLPPLVGKDEYEYSLDAVRARRAGIREAVEDIFTQALSSDEEIEAAFSGIGFRLLASRPVRFECSCSRKRVIQGLWSVHHRQQQELFDPGQTFLDVTCEYCKKKYRVSREDLEGPGQGTTAPH